MHYPLRFKVNVTCHGDVTSTFVLKVTSCCLCSDSSHLYSAALPRWWEVFYHSKRPGKSRERERGLMRKERKERGFRGGFGQNDCQGRIAKGFLRLKRTFRSTLISLCSLENAQKERYHFERYHFDTTLAGDIMCCKYKTIKTEKQWYSYLDSTFVPRCSEFHGQQRST